MKSVDTAVSTLRRLFVRRAPLKVDAYAPYTRLSFSDTDHVANAFADIIEERFEGLAEILLTYESYEVVQDEVARTLDVLRNLDENREYFELRINEVASFLPRNQPLYSFTCFVIIPSLMASKVHYRIPHSMRVFFPKMLALLEVQKLFPNVITSTLPRLEFLRERSALRINPLTNETIPVTDAVIFTGLSFHAEQLRVVFDDRTLFIANGAGHNPVVISHDADIDRAVSAAIDLQLYNQGQDCSAPNAILVHRDVSEDVLEQFRSRLQKENIGHFVDRSCRVGPISKPDDLTRVQKLLIDNAMWLDESTPGIVRARDAIVEPTIITKPLKEGGNYTEIFAPILFVQKYESDAELSHYFENPLYAAHAMYISLYGTSAYVQSLINKPLFGRVLHNMSTILSNQHPHDKGVERGTQPYGGFGQHTSSITIHGKTDPQPTLPQRDIYIHLVKPISADWSRVEVRRRELKKFSKIRHRNVEKLLRLLSQEKQGRQDDTGGVMYVDTHALKKDKHHRFALLEHKSTYTLLQSPNAVYIARLKLTDLELIRALRKLLHRRSALPHDEFRTLLYALAAKPGTTQKENRAGQHDFFRHMYQLLFGKNTGPNLSHFLIDADLHRLEELLDV